MKKSGEMRKRLLPLAGGVLILALLFGCSAEHAGEKPGQELEEQEERAQEAEGAGQEKKNQVEEENRNQSSLQTEDSVNEAKEDSEEEKDKEETVYIKADARGNVKEIQVETLLRVKDGSQEILDRSTLSDIKNTKGDEEFTKGTDGSLLWENHGEDIHYKGKTSEELPVSVKISYFLEGEEISPEEIVGKSGEVRIRFDYENHTLETIAMDDKEVEMPVPFAVFSAVLLPEETFSNIKVNNGKVLSMDGQSIALGYAFPGLKEGLSLSAYEPTEDIELPDYVEITALASEFELEFTATVISPGIFEDFDTKDLEEIEDLTESMEELKDASKELVDGTGELLEGVEEFQDYLEEYTDGADAVNDGVKALRDGLEMLNTQKTNLETGASGLEKGLEALYMAVNGISLPGGTGSGEGAGSHTEAGAGQGERAEGNLAADGGADEETKAGETAGGSMPSLAEVQASLNGKAEQAQNAAAAALEEALGENDTLTLEEKEAIKQKVADSLKESLDVSTEVSVLQAYTASLSDTANSLSGMGETLAGLKSGVGELYAGSKQLTEGVQAFNKGIGQLYDGSVQLRSGTKELSDAGTKLMDGFDEAVDGVRSLKEGMEEFDKEGIQELSDLAGEELENLVTRLRAAKEADQNYKNFAGISEGKTGSVKFILETEEIKK